MSSFSLQASLATCKVRTENADKVQSDRFLNTNALACNTWNGTDLVGRSVCPDSFMTKAPGCNSAEDRVLVENEVTRPYYYAFIGLNNYGLETGGVSKAGAAVVDGLCEPSSALCQAEKNRMLQNTPSWDNGTLTGAIDCTCPNSAMTQQIANQNNRYGMQSQARGKVEGFQRASGCGSAGWS
jgi:hypothetical protein